MVSCRTVLDKSHRRVSRTILVGVKPVLLTPAARPWAVTAHPVGSPESQEILLRYYTEVSDRYFGRPTLPDLLAAGFADQDSAGLTAPRGEFFLAWSDRGRGPEAVGCAGIELVPDASEPTAQLRRVFVTPDLRGLGIAGALLDAVEDAARRLGAHALRLDTRHDLVEALGLYARRGYRDVPAFNDDQYAQRWLALSL